MTLVNPKPRVSGSPRDRPTHVFARRVLDTLGAVFIFTWWTAFTIVFLGFCLTSVR